MKDPAPLRSTAANRVAQAIVSFPRGGGRGILVPGRMIVTAAHVIHWKADGTMALSDSYVEEMTASDEQVYRVQPLAVESVSDLAVLGALNGMVSAEFAEAAEAFESLCAVITPIALETGEFELATPCPAYGSRTTRGSSR